MQKIILWVLAVVIVAGGWFLFSSRASAPTVSESAEAPAQEAVDADTGADAVQAQTPGTNVAAAVTSSTVTYNGSTFSPSSVTVKKGGTVTFTSTAGNMWVASAPHPAHTGYDGTSAGEHCASGYTGGAPFDQCVAGTSFTFTFDKVGTWKYHNHLNAAAHGSVIVE